MNFDNQPTIQIPQLGGTAPIIRTTDTTPAIQALMDATRQGAIDFDTINDHFAKGAKQAAAIDAMGTASVKDRNERELLPQIQALNKKAKELEALVQTDKLKNRPLESQIERQALEVKGIKAQGAYELAPGEVTLAREKQADELKYGAAPSPEIEQLALKSNVNPRDASGHYRPIADIYKDISESSMKSRPLTAEQASTEQADITTTEQTLTQMKEASKQLFVHDAAGNVVRNADGSAKLADLNSVGPILGSAIGQTFVQGAAGFGMFKKTYEGQRKMEMLHNNITRDKTAALKGPLSEKELKFLQGSVPKIDDTEAIWDNYLKEYIPVIESSIQRRKAMLSASGGPTAAAAATVGHPAAAPASAAAPSAAGRPPGVNDQGFIPTSDPVYQIQSKVAVPWPGIAGMNKLQSGQPYFDHRGNLRIKGNK